MDWSSQNLQKCQNGNDIGNFKHILFMQFFPAHHFTNMSFSPVFLKLCCQRQYLLVKKLLIIFVILNLLFEEGFNFGVSIIMLFCMTFNVNVDFNTHLSHLLTHYQMTTFYVCSNLKHLQTTK